MLSGFTPGHNKIRINQIELNKINHQKKLFFSQITSSIAPKFEKLIQAVRSIRKAVQDTVDAKRIYTRSQRDPDEVCKDATDLEEDPYFPGVGVSFHYNMVVRLSWTKIVKMVWMVTPTVIPSSSTCIEFFQTYKNN